MISSQLIHSNARTEKRRASQACSSCRVRKVRCDMMECGLPCTKCRIDGFNCMAESTKKRHKRASRTAEMGLARSGQEPTRARQTTALAESGEMSDQEITRLQPSISTVEYERQESSLSSPLPSATPRHIILHKIPHSPFLLDIANVHLNDASGDPLTLSQQVENKYRGIGAINFLDAEHTSFLRKQGALDLLPERIMDEFIMTYFRIFHPFFPIIDKVKFLNDYGKMDKGGRLPERGVSLLLLQSIFFISSSLVPFDHVKELGFSSRKHARRVFHTRARYLYDFNYEINDIVSIQALLLMSHYYPSMVDQKHTWHWVNQAICLAQGLGLHQNPGNVAQRKLWARIWWACLVRDRLVSLGTGRPMHINSLDCTVPMLTFEDVYDEGDGDEERAVKLIFLDFAKLCQYMEGVLSLRRTVLLEERMIPDQLRVCESTLQRWLSNISPEARLQNEPLIGEGHTCIATLYRAVLHLVYQTVMIALYQPLHMSEITESENFHRTPREVVQVAASHSTQLAAQLVNFNLVRYCPTICVTAVLSPLIIHLLDIRAAPTAELKQLHTNRYNLCMIFLRELGQIYWHASIYYSFLELAQPVENSSSKSMPRNDDPLVAFLQQQMMLKGIETDATMRGRVSRLTERQSEIDSAESFLRLNTCDQDSHQAETRTRGFDAEYDAATSSAPVTEEEGSPLNSTDINSESFFNFGTLQFEEYIKLCGSIHSIFPSA